MNLELNFKGSLQKECDRVHFNEQQSNNIVCRCNATHRDHLLFDWPLEESKLVRVSSNWAGLRFSLDELELEEQIEEELSSEESKGADFLVDLRADKRAQQVIGYGGAFTDSASELITMLPHPVKMSLLEDYFGPSGLDYNMGRVPISGTDMSSRAYSYDDLPPGEEDFELKKFRLQEEDLLFKIPLIKLVNNMKANRHLEELKLIAASWSAPAWMKSNLRLVQGKIKGTSSSGPYYRAYARYVLRFLEEYEQRQVRMWALTPQNEPHTPGRVGPKKINFNSVNFSPDEMADYLAHSLIPSLLEANRTASELRLFVWDDTLDGMNAYLGELFKEKEVKNFIAGVAIHWYSQGLREKPYQWLHDARSKLIPANLGLISSEACFIGEPRPGVWDRGMGYARDIIENLRAGSLAWIDWNLALNTSGGPTWSNNLLDSAILVDLNEQAYMKNPMYYALGHLSRFIKANSSILQTNIFKRAPDNGSWLERGLDDQLTAIAAELAEPAIIDKQLRRKVALVLLNRAFEVKKVRVNFEHCSAKANHRPLEVELSAKSITSLAFLC